MTVFSFFSPVLRYRLELDRAVAEDELKKNRQRDGSILYNLLNLGIKPCEGL